MRIKKRADSAVVRVPPSLAKLCEMSAPALSDAAPLASISSIALKIDKDKVLKWVNAFVLKTFPWPQLPKVDLFSV